MTSVTSQGALVLGEIIILIIKIVKKRKKNLARIIMKLTMK